VVLDGIREVDMKNSEYAGKKGLYSLEFEEAGGWVRAQAEGPLEAAGEVVARDRLAQKVARVVEKTMDEARLALVEQLERMGA
jgi:hypothetical protein